MVTENDIRRGLGELRMQICERYMHLMGIDAETVRDLENDINAQYAKLGDDVREIVEDAGREFAVVHDASLARARELFLADIWHPIWRPIQDVQFAWGCTYPSTAPVLGWSDNVTPPSEGTGTATVTYAANEAHPFAEVQGRGVRIAGLGTADVAQVNTWVRFSFTPSEDGSYCIRPLVYMNGYWLLWTWGGVPGLGIPSLGGVRVTLRVRVDQLSLTVRQIEHDVVNVAHGLFSGNDSNHAGWNYDSEVDGGATMGVSLQGGHDAVIFVECETYVYINGNGMALVDMQTSPHFYFRVPELRWGPIAAIPM